MGILIIIVVGILVGWLASAVVGSGGGIVFDMVVGMVGSLIAGWLFGRSFLTGGISLMSILWSVVGAIILLLILRLIQGGFHRRL